MNWFPALLYLWAAGISGALSFVPSRELGRRFFQVHAVLLLLLVAVATSIARPFFDGFSGGTLRLLTGAVTWALIVDVVLVASLAFSRKHLPAAAAFLLPVIAGAFLAVAIALSVEPGRPGRAALLTAHLLTCGALLGSVLVAMNLGHSYLQNAALSFEHLARLAKLFLGSAIAKALVSVGLLAPEIGRWWPQLLESFEGMLILVRIAAGLAGSIVLALMVLSCVRARANQSATGILYAALVVVLVAEGISMYLTLGPGIRA